MSNPSPPAMRALQYVVLAALVLFLLSGSYLFYRVAMIAYRVEQATVAISSDVQRVTGVVGKMADDVAALRGEIGRLKDAARDAIPVEEARRAIDEAMATTAALKADTSELPAQADREIHELLQRLRNSGLRYQAGDEDHAILSLYARLYAKFKLREKSLTSAEDFIDQLATETTLGKPYQVIEKDGTRTPLQVWLKARLMEIRAGKPAQ